MASKQSDVLSFFGNFEAAARKADSAEAPAFVTGIRHQLPGLLLGAGLQITMREQAVSTKDVRPTHRLPRTIGRLAQGEHFSIFKREHAEEAASVYNYLLSLDSYDEFKIIVECLPAVLNEGIYMYALSVALLHRKDTIGDLLPPSWEINPRCFFPHPIILKAKRAARRSKPEVTTVADTATPLFTTGTNRDTEFRLAWWREDVGLNGHHYHWHQVYPYSGVQGRTKDRQGELFYYMHQQMVARYDAERLGVGLLRVDPYVNWTQPIPEGYNSQLTTYYDIYQFAARPSNMYLADSWCDPDDPNLVSQQSYHYNRLLDAVNSGKFSKDDHTEEDVTIDSLGAAVEASVSSPNIALYGSVHNSGHDLLANITDPDGRYQMAGGVMGDTTTAVRDPIFFRWHKFIDNLFVLHKLNLPPYTNEELSLNGLTIKSLQVHVKEHGEPNILTTRMENKKVNIIHDMFLDPSEPINTEIDVIVKQVNHDKFKYRLTIDSERVMKVAIRIFIAPTCDEHGNQHTLSTQRRLCIEMDKFVQTMTIGENTITRSSTASSVIKPTDLTYDQLKKRNRCKPAKSDCPCLADRYCECGWPEHMLLPRGTGSGMKFDLFVMATDWAADSATDDLDKGTSYCGVKNDVYPDSRSMGFPFDRRLIDYNTIADFGRSFTNMYTIPITIKYN